MTRDRLLVTVAWGIGLGVFARAADHVGPHWVGDMAAVWVAIAFVVGRGISQRRAGAIAGVITLVLASLTYYLWRVWIDQTISAPYLLSVAVIWTLTAVICGAASGWLGSASASRPSAWGWVAGAFLGEGVAILFLHRRPLQVALEMGVAALFLIPARGALRRSIALTLVAALALGAVAAGFRLARRVRRTHAESSAGLAVDGHFRSEPLGCRATSVLE